MVGLLLYAWLLAGGALLIAAVRRLDEALGLALMASLPRPVRPRALLQRLPGGPDHVARARRGRRISGLARRVRPAPDGGRARPRRAGTTSAGSGRKRPVSVRAAWALVGVLFALIAITLPELGSDPWRFRPGERRPPGPARPARACGRRGVGRGHRACRGLRRGAPLRRSGGAPDRPAAALAELGRHCARADRRRAPDGALDAAPARPARLHRALVLHERLDLPDRARRRSPARPRQPLRARLPRVRARALLHTRRQRLGAGARARGGARALRLLSGRSAHGSSAGSSCPSRSTTTGCWSCSPRSRCSRPPCSSALRSV